MAEPKTSTRKPAVKKAEVKRPNAVKCTIHFSDGTSKDYTTFVASLVGPTKGIEKFHGEALETMTPESECFSVCHMCGDRELVETELVLMVTQLRDVMKDMPETMKQAVMIKCALAELTHGIILDGRHSVSSRVRTHME